jgi:4'-phosphopantetheinyl transferase
MSNRPESCVWNEIVWTAWQKQLSEKNAVCLGQGELNIWLVSLQLPPQEAQQCLSWLSPEERKRAGEFRFSADSARYIAAHGLLRFILAGYTGKRPAELEFSVNTFGKPEVSIAGSPMVNFNLSHSGDMALIAVIRGQEVGVDIEKADCKLEYTDIVDLFFSHPEKRIVDAAPSKQRLERFYTIWTGKEAYLKMLGIGFAEEAGERQAGYALWNFTPHPDYHGAVAVSGKVLACRYYRLL